LGVPLLKKKPQAATHPPVKNELEIIAVVHIIEGGKKKTPEAKIQKIIEPIISFLAA
jgi:hypothetical protein